MVSKDQNSDIEPIQARDKIFDNNYDEYVYNFDPKYDD